MEVPGGEEKGEKGEKGDVQLELDIYFKIQHSTTCLYYHM